MYTGSFIYKENQNLILTSSRDKSLICVISLPKIYDMFDAEMIFSKDVAFKFTRNCA